MKVTRNSRGAYPSKPKWICIRQCLFLAHSMGLGTFLVLLQPILWFPWMRCSHSSLRAHLVLHKTKPKLKSRQEPLEQTETATLLGFLVAMCPRVNELHLRTWGSTREANIIREMSAMLPLLLNFQIWQRLCDMICLKYTPIRPILLLLIWSYLHRYQKWL